MRAETIRGIKSLASMAEFAAVALLIAGGPASAANTVPVCSPTISGDAARELVRAEAERQGFDQKLAVAILNQESRAGTDINSPAGARGLMQLMPATAERYGVKDVCDAADNARGGVAYLKDLTAQFGGNVFLVVAAYNAGETRVLDAHGVPANAETVRYVASIANSYYEFDNFLNSKRVQKPAERPRHAPALAAGIERAGVAVDSAGQKWIGGVLYVEGDGN